MKLDRIHQISEIIASVAIVASLIFVGIQVSQNTSALKLTAATTNASNWQNLMIARASNTEALQTLVDTNERPEGTPPPDINFVRLATLFVADLKSAEHLYLQWLDGNLSDELWQTNREGLIVVLAESPIYRNAFKDEFSTGAWTPTFLALVDGLLPEVNAMRARMKLLPLSSAWEVQAASEAAVQQEQASGS